MGMKVIHQRDRIQEAPKRFSTQYEHYGNKLNWRKEPMDEVIAKLDALDTTTCTAEDIDKIIGNDSWTTLTCSECEQQQTMVIHIGDEPGYEARWVQLCRECLVRATTLIMGTEEKP